MPKPCPQSAKNAGAQLVKLRRMGGDFAAQAFVVYAAIKAAQLDVEGSKVMQVGEALEKILDAARCEGLVGSAHNSLRGVIGNLNYSEPTDADIVAILGPEIMPRGGGGGGGRGRGR